MMYFAPVTNATLPARSGISLSKGHFCCSISESEEIWSYRLLSADHRLSCHDNILEQRGNV